MKKVTRQTLAYDQRGIQLSQREIQALAMASRIAEQARDLARTIEPDFESDDTDLWLAVIEHNCEAFAVDGFILVEEVRGGILL